MAVRILTILLVVTTLLGADEEPTVGWLGSEPTAYLGYTVLAPTQATTTYLLDSYGRVVHTWASQYRPGNSVYLLEDGTLLKTGRFNGPSPPISAGGVGGLFQKFDWDGTLLWQFEYSSPTVQHHHDIEPLPNGNVLMVAWELRTEAEAIQAGRNPAQISQGELWPEQIIEVAQTGPTTGEIVWEWHLWDHLIQDFDPTRDNFGVVADHPELVDINAMQGAGADWIHCNSIDYHPELDQILLSSPFLNEIWIIDHSTTTAEAAGHTGGASGRGGDLLYRWGNPANYGAGDALDRKLFGQHCAEWIPEGYPGADNILLFNNGVGRPGGSYSSMDEITPPVDGFGYTLVPGAAYGPTDLTWTWAAADPTDFLAPFISGTRRLPNGNTIIAHGPDGYLLEVTDAGDIVWEYVNPVGGGSPVAQGTPSPDANVFRPNKYAPDYPGLAGRDLTPGPPIESYPTLGDFTGDGDVDLDDYDCFVAEFTGECSAPCPAPIVDDAMAYYVDFDSDGDVDCADWESFQLAWTAGAIPGFDPCSTEDFIRGDVTGNIIVDLVDPIALLNHLFNSQPIGCQQAADANDDDQLDLTDPIRILNTLFAGGEPIPAPTGTCGPDPTPGVLTCDTGCP